MPQAGKNGSGLGNKHNSFATDEQRSTAQKHHRGSVCCDDCAGHESILLLVCLDLALEKHHWGVPSGFPREEFGWHRSDLCCFCVCFCHG